MSDAQIINMLETIIQDIKNNRYETRKKEEMYEKLLELTSQENEGWDRLAAIYLFRGWYLSNLLEENPDLTKVNYCPLCLNNNDI